MNDSNPISFSSQCFPRIAQLREKAQIPTAFCYEPMKQGLNPVKCDLPQCSNCGAYPVQKNEIGSAANICTFCGNPFNHPSYQIPEVCEMISQESVPVPKTLIIIDATLQSVKNNFIFHVLQSVRNLADNYTNIAFMTISDEIGLLMPNDRIMLIPDVDDSLVPPSVFFEKIPENITVLHSLHQKDKGPDVYAALTLASKIIGENGRVIMFLCNPPRGTVDFDKVPVSNENGSIRGSNFYKFEELKNTFLNMQVVVEFFMYAIVPRLIDAASLGKLAAHLGGRIFYMNNSQEWKIQTVITDFLRGKDTTTKIYSSIGTKILPSLGIVPHHPLHTRVITPHTLTYPLTFSDTLIGPIYIQSVTKWIDAQGHTHTQVCTRMAGITDNPAEVFSSANMGVILKYISNTLLNFFYNKEEATLSKMDDYALALLKPIFYSYRMHISNSPSKMKNLVISQSLQKLPTYVLGVLKSTAFHNGIAYDERAYQMFEINSMSPFMIMFVGYPRLIEANSFIQNGTEPEVLPLKDFEMRSDRLLVLFNGFLTFIWIGKDLDRDLCLKTFGKANPHLVDKVVPIDSDESKRLYTLIIGNHRLFNESKQDNSNLFQDRLIEDASVNKCSEAKWYTMVHNVSLPPQNQK